MITTFFSGLETLNNFIWGHFAFVLIAGLGGYFCWKSRFFQIRKWGAIWGSFFRFFVDRNKKKRGIHPMKAFFAGIGGCIGIGNIVGICTAVQIGGPGALFWTWIGALFGMLIQYAEVYLGLRYRVKTQNNNFDGGPMYFLPVAYRGRWVAVVVCFLLCVYGVEIFMFNVMVDSISVNWHIDLGWVVAMLLVATLGVALGGIKRVGELCSGLLPLFIFLYIGMGLWILALHIEKMPGILWQILEGAFTTQAAEGAFAGSSVMLALSMGLSRGAYSGDIGVGYTSVIHSESRTHEFGRQSALTIVGVFLDTFVICTMSIFLVLITGVWKEGMDVSLMVQEALGSYFPYMSFFMPFFLFLLGYSTILAYFVVGVKCAKFLSPKWGPRLYYAYACIALPLFSFVQPEEAFLIMSICGAFLLLFNLVGIFILRKEVEFSL